MKTQELVEMLEQKAKGERNKLGDVWGDWICETAAIRLSSMNVRILELEVEVEKLRTVNYYWHDNSKIP